MFEAAALDGASMKVLHMKQIAKMARITPAVTLATLKQSSLARQMLSDLMRKNKRELDLRRRIKENAGVRASNAESVPRRSSSRRRPGVRANGSSRPDLSSLGDDSIS